MHHYLSIAGHDDPLHTRCLKRVSRPKTRLTSGVWGFSSSAKGILSAECTCETRESSRHWKFIDDEINLVNAADATRRKGMEPGVLVATLQACVWQDDGSMFMSHGYVSTVNCGESPMMVQYLREVFVVLHP